MRRFLNAVFSVFLILTVISCASTPKDGEVEKKGAPKKKEAVKKESYGKLGDEFMAHCKKEKTAIDDIAANIKSSPAERKGIEILDLFNKMEMRQVDVLTKSGIYQMNHPDEGMRKSAMKCEQILMAQNSELVLDFELYSAVAAIAPDDASLGDEDKYFLKDVIADFKRNGVDKDEKVRKELKELSLKLTELEQKFYSNIGSDRKTMVIKDKAKLKGLPEDFLANHKPNEKGEVTLTTDWPDYIAVMEYAADPSLREEMYRNKRTTGYPANTEVMSEFLKTRMKFANMLGYENWAEYSQAKLMIETPKNADEFINKVSELTKEYSDRDMAVLLEYKKKDQPEAAEMEPWDNSYYSRIAKMDKYDFDPDVARKYFEIDKVIKGMFLVASKIYGVEFKEVKRDDIWHPSVKSYSILEDGKEIGQFEFDLYPRENKYKHFAMFTNVLGVKDVRNLRAAIIGNFPEPKDGKAYLPHNDVQTLFHEFGHLLHMLFAGQQKYSRFSGTQCQRDFVEVPSQLFEEWIWDTEILQLFATDDEGNPIPAELVENMKKASEFGKGFNVRQQMYYAMLSLGIYLQDPKDFDFHKYEKEIEKKYSPWKSYDGIHMTEGFGHLIGYASNYYTYMWSLVIVKDLYEFIKENGGMMNPEIMKKYRKAVLSKGGSEKSALSVKDFTGREFTFEAFEKWLKN